MAELNDLSTSAASNTGRFPNGMNIDQLNDASRELEAMQAREFKDRTGQVASAGTGAAYTLIPNRAVTAYAAGQAFLFKAHVVNTGAATLAISGLAAKPLRKQNGDALQAGDIAAQQMVFAIYNASNDRFDCLGIGDGSASNGIPSFTKTTLPAVTDARVILVTDEVGGITLAFSDGTNWRRVQDRAVVS